MKEDLLTRSVAHVYPSGEALKTVLESGKQLRIYFGIDPTGPDLHLGHAVPLQKLREFQDLGHQAILLIGDFTAMIGDPTDKTAARVQLTREQVLANCKDYLSQAWKILDEEKTEVRYNSEWLAKLSLDDLLELASNLTAGQLLKRDMFQKRLGEGKEVYFHELFYPMMQGYDSVALDVDMEIGGSDQIFNMLVGRDLMKTLKQKEKLVLATKLLAAPGEFKMSKSEGNMVTLSDTPSDMYGKVMSWPDSILPLAFELLTSSQWNKSAHPRDEKMRLAREVLTRYHSATAAQVAEENFINTFQKKEEPSEWEKIAGLRGEKISEVLVGAGVLKSKSEFRRLVEEGAVHLWPEGTVTDPDLTLTASLKLKLGKRRFVELQLN